ncbi:MAG: ribosome recycling factor [Anaerolineae bacterium]|nr:ribosome recycling factor [Anaerolineae bacterium]
MIDDVEREARGRMEAAIESLRADLASIRTGRASPALLDRVRVDYYGSPTPLQQLASISVPEPTQLLIRPWERNILGAIERAILASDLGLTPNNDGQVIRLSIPALTEERRRELVRQVHRRVEEGRVAIRNVRRDALNDLRELQNEKEITEDDFYQSRDQLQKLTDEYIKRLEEVGKEKEQEILQV